MESLKSESQRDKLNRLFKEYGLLSEDVHKHQHYTIIRRTGIEKIAAGAGIRLSYEACNTAADYAAVKATAKKGKGPNMVCIETFGSACPATSQNKYYLEMAEKRAMSRAVLKLTDFSAAGAYGEDEADDFDRRRNPEPAQGEVPTQRPGKPEVEGLGPVLVPPAASGGAGPNNDADAENFLAKAVILDLINEQETLEELQGVWIGEAKPWQKDVDVFAAKEARKEHLIKNQTLR